MVISARFFGLILYFSLIDNSYLYILVLPQKNPSNVKLIWSGNKVPYLILLQTISEYGNFFSEKTHVWISGNFRPDFSHTATFFRQAFPCQWKNYLWKKCKTILSDIRLWSADIFSEIVHECKLIQTGLLQDIQKSIIWKTKHVFGF